MADAEADRHDGVTSGPGAGHWCRDPPEVNTMLQMSPTPPPLRSHSPVPVVPLAKLTELVVPPAPGLASLVHHHHVSRLLAAAHHLDPHVLQGFDSLRFEHIVL